MVSLVGRSPALVAGQSVLRQHTLLPKLLQVVALLLCECVCAFVFFKGNNVK